MKVLIAVYPFMNSPETTGEIEFVVNPWGRDPDSSEIEEELVGGNYDALIVGTKKVNNSILNRSNSLKVISRVGVGVNNIDIKLFRKHGVVTTFTPFGPTDSTAEMALALILAGTRRLCNYDNLIRNREWQRDFHLRLMDATVGIVGYGRIGKRLTCLLRPLGCEILLHDIKPDLATAHAMGLRFVAKDYLLQHADVVTFHLPLKEDTYHWLSYPDLALADRPVTFVNTARGGIVNEEAMYDYLKSNPESYYCCDAFEEEPYKGRMVELDNTLLTPHSSSFTVGSRKQTELLAIENCLKVLRGEPCDFIVESNE